MSPRSPRSTKAPASDSAGAAHRPVAYLTITEAAEYLRCSTKHLRRLVTGHRLTAYKAGSERLLFKIDDLDALLTVVDPGDRPAPTSMNAQAQVADGDRDATASWIETLMRRA